MLATGLAFRPGSSRFIFAPRFSLTRLLTGTLEQPPAPLHRPPSPGAAPPGRPPLSPATPAPLRRPPPPRVRPRLPVRRRPRCPSGHPGPGGKRRPAAAGPRPEAAPLEDPVAARCEGPRQVGPAPAVLAAGRALPAPPGGGCGLRAGGAPTPEPGERGWITGYLGRAGCV